MKGRKTNSGQRRSTRGKATKPCEALMVVDGAPIRDETKKEYDRLVEETRHVRKQLDRFYEEDKPSYDRWYHAQFGALLTKIRATRQACDEKEELLEEIQAEMVFEGMSGREAYDHVIDRRENGEEEADWRGERDWEDGEELGDEGDSDEEDFRKGSGEWWSGRDGPEDGKENGRPGGEPSGRRKTGVGARVKELYRALVRRLHPDKLREPDHQTLERWHQVQAAYENNDQDQLEVLLSLCEIEDNGTTGSTSVSLLMRVNEQLMGSLKQLKRQLYACRRDPAWGFASRQDRHLLEANMRCSLEDELEELQQKLRSMERILGRLSGGQRAGGQRAQGGR